MSESGMKMNFCRVMAGMALRYRDNLAVVNVERGRRYTFPDYHRLTNRIANMARDTLGLRKGDVALLILDNDNFSLVHFPAIFKQEATFAFSNLRDSREEHARQIAYIKPKVVFIETRLIGAYRELLEREGCTIVAMDRERELPADALCFWDLIEAASEADNDVELNPREHISIIRFTGGTTGVGKCAMYTADHFFACRDSFYIHADFDCDESARYLALTPLSHASLMLFTAVFFTGGTTFSLNIADLPAWCETVQREGITHGLLVPTLLYRLLDMRGAELYRLSTLRTLVYGAAPIARPAVERLIRDFGQIFIQIYGSSEAATCVSVLNKRDHNVDSGLALERLGSAGRISPGVELIVTDADGVPLPTGTTGEIWIRSRATIGGYTKTRKGLRRSLPTGSGNPATSAM